MKEALDGAIARLLKHDDHLLFNDVNERSITHKLGEHLQSLLPDFDVDCEYNRNHNVAKRLKSFPSKGITNTDIKEGDEVVAVGVKGLEVFRTEFGLDQASGPRYFGFDIDYVPIEELMKA